MDPVSQRCRDTARLRIDISGALFERTGLVLIDESEDRHPHFRPLPGYWAMISGPLTDQEIMAQKKSFGFRSKQGNLGFGTPVFRNQRACTRQAPLVGMQNVRNNPAVMSPLPSES